MPRSSVGKYISILWATLFIAGLIGVETLILQASPKSQSDSQPRPEQPINKEQPCRPIPDLALAWVPIRTRLCFAVYRNIIFFDAYHDTINAFSTLLVAIFTFTLWRSTKGLFIAGEKQIALLEQNAIDQSTTTSRSLDIAQIGATAARESASASIRSADAAIDTVEIERQALVETQRAFIYLHRIKPKCVKNDAGVIVGWNLNVVWRNAGVTPSKRTSNYIGLHWRGCYENQFGSDADFISIAKQVPELYTIGPKNRFGATERLPANVALSLRSKVQNGYLFGWVDYDDVYAGTARRRTEFCVQIFVDGSPLKEDCKFIFIRTGNFNGSDEDCRSKPAPYSPPTQKPATT